jgi:hypothetical protein
MQLDNLHQSVRETLAGQSVVLPETLGEAEQVALREWQQQLAAAGSNGQLEKVLIQAAQLPLWGAKS